MFNRPQYVAVAFVAMLSLVLLSLPRRTADRLKLAISSIFVPLLGVAGSIQQATGAAMDAMTSRRELLRMNEALMRENQQLRLIAMQAEAIHRENDRLRNAIAWQRQTKWKLKPGRVVLRDPASWWRTVQINLGSRDGMVENLPVLTPDGLVGRITSVGLTRSQVMLVGDPACRVAAVIDNPKRDQGVVGVAAGVFDGSLVEMNFIPKDSAVVPGQKVKTSGEGGFFPGGITIGTVAEAHPVEYGLFTQAQIKLAAHLGGLEEVWVLMP